MYIAEFLNDPRYVDLAPLVRSSGSTVGKAVESLLISTGDILPCLRSYGMVIDELEEMIENRHTPTLHTYIFHIQSGVLLVHLGAVQVVCKILSIPFPEKSLFIRLECIKRPDSHNRHEGFLGALESDRLLLQTQNIESLICKIPPLLDVEKDATISKHLLTLIDILQVEYDIQNYRFLAK